MNRLLWLALVLAVGCASRRSGVDMNLGTDIPPTEAVRRAVVEDVAADTLRQAKRRAEVLTLPQGSVERIFDLLHTELDVRPDLPTQTLEGTARLRLRPYFFTQDSLILDAKGFRIDEVALETGAGRQPLPWRYDSLRLRIALDRPYRRTDSLTVFVRYLAQPESLKSYTGQAVADHQGLYFINADGSDPYKPRQFWTQSQPQSASCWFPTLDQPNERTTSVIRLTVPDSFVTLSNGVLTAQAPATRTGERTDTWRMDLPHAPYLFMIAGGRFVVTEDRWRGRPVQYYLEPEYAPYARLIFGHTPEMMDFFSERFGVDFPWAKYAQIVVRDFVSGAMENTTAVVHMEDVQHDARAHLDANQEEYISHELVHHWFGDYVTCESWTHTTLNEAFATYGEVLWKEHKYGLAEAQKHLASDRQIYFDEAANEAKDLIRYAYGHPDEMFDRHSYQKGGCILHMLRHHLGNEAFWASVRHYLQKHAFRPVEADELRLAFEEITGRDLHWFFDQWFFDKGHPQLEVDYSWAADTGVLRVRIQQRQAHVSNFRLFRLPTHLRIEQANGTERLIELDLRRADTTLEIALAAEPRNAELDPERSLLAQWQERKPEGWWLHQLRRRESFLAVQAACANQQERAASDPATEAAWLALLDSPEAALRELAYPAAFYDSSAPAPAQLIERTWEVVRNDPNALMRYVALDLLAQQATSGERWDALLRDAVRDSSYAVSLMALRLLHERQPEEALAVAQTLRASRHGRTRATVARILLQAGHVDATAYLNETLRRLPNAYDRLFLVQDYAESLSDTVPDADLEPLMERARVDHSWLIRFAAGQLLRHFAGRPAVDALFDELAQTEKNERLREFYRSLR